MKIDGVWILEVSGIHGWERISTVFLEKGRYLSGSANIFSHGTYKTKGKKVKFKLKVTQHGKKQVMFGEKLKQFNVVMQAKYNNNKIEGKMSMAGAHSRTSQYTFRLLRLADIPAKPK